MRYTQNALDILTAKSFKNIGNAWIAKNWVAGLSNSEIVGLLSESSSEKVTIELFNQVREHIEYKLSALDESCDGVTALGDSDFPEYRGKVKDSDKPNVLFYKGDLSLLSKENKNIAVIGVLTPSEETEKDERRVVDLLVKDNAVIISGLALGCDRIAHHQALVSKGKTVAILPSPLNNIIPKECLKLGTYIGENGSLLISEYYDEPKSGMELSSRYIHRDRLQALFSDMVVLTASYTPESQDPKADKIDSGSRHAMNKAKEYGIPQAVIYHHKNEKDPKYDLNRKIIAENKNVFVINPEENINLNIMLQSNIENEEITKRQVDMFG